MFLVYRSKGTVGRAWNYLLMLTSIGALSYWIYNFEAINYRAGAETELDQWVAMIGVLATYIILFVIFGAFLEKSGAQRFFIDSPLAAAGHKIGGAGGLHHGRADWPALFANHAGRHFPGPDVFLQCVYDGSLRSQETQYCRRTQ